MSVCWLRGSWAGWLALVVCGAGCRPPEQKDAPGREAAPAIPVAVAPVRFSAEALPLEATGVLSRKEETELAFKIGGVVAEVTVRAGDTVKAGQVLARLKPEEIEAEVAQARAALAKARRDQERTVRLLQDQVITREQAQNAETAVEQAEAAVQAAEFNWRFAVIEAPADGTILRRLAEPSQLVAGGRPILVFAPDREGWLLRVSVPAADAARLAVGNRAEYWVGGAGSALAATVSHLGGGADPIIRTAEVELRPTTVPVRALAGTVAHVRLFPPDGEVRPIIPAAALVEGRGHEASVFRLEGDSTVRRERVTVTALAGTEAFLETRLPAGARVVTAGAEYLKDGASVRIVGPGPEKEQP